MTITANFLGNLEIQTHFALTGTGSTTVFTAESKGLAGEVSFANDTGSAVQCKVYRWDGTTAWLIWTGSVAANSTGGMSIPSRLNTSDEIRVVGANNVTVTISIIRMMENAR